MTKLKLYEFDFGWIRKSVFAPTLARALEMIKPATPQTSVTPDSEAAFEYQFKSVSVVTLPPALSALAEAAYAWGSYAHEPSAEESATALQNLFDAVKGVRGVMG